MTDLNRFLLEFLTMVRVRKPGRKSRPRTTAEKLLMAEMSQQLYAKMRTERWDKKRAAKELGVSLASFYNYLNQDDLPNYEIFKKAHDIWEFKFQYMDFGGKRAASRSITPAEFTRQTVLPFIESVRENDIEIIKAKPVSSDILQLTINIKFAG